MGAKKLYSELKIIDGCGYFLFGAEHYSPTDTFVGKVPFQGEMNLYVFSEAFQGEAGDKFVNFQGHLARLRDLYEDVMQHADPIKALRNSHQSLDTKFDSKVSAHLNSRAEHIGLQRMLRDNGYNWMSAELALFRDKVPAEFVDSYLRENGQLGYGIAAASSQLKLEQQLERLESVDGQMREFNQLLYNELRKTVLSARGQKIILDKFGSEGIKEASVYFANTVKLLPEFCPRLEGLRRLSSDSLLERSYVTDDLREYSAS